MDKKRATPNTRSAARRKADCILITIGTLLTAAVLFALLTRECAL